MPEIDLTALAVIFAALALGGALKGATGAGTPVVAVPVMAAFFDVRLAVVIMVTPNIVSNFWQTGAFWHQRLGQGFTLKFAVAGGMGAIAGTAFLATMPERVLTLLVAGAVVLYIGLRLARPDFRLAFDRANRLSLPAGLVAGILQGAAGISAPISVSFLNAMRLERPQFIATISTFFLVMSMAQLPAQMIAGLLTPQLFGLSIAALIPVFALMPVGAWLARKLSAEAFDKLMLVLLSLLAIRLIYASFA